MMTLRLATRIEAVEIIEPQRHCAGAGTKYLILFFWRVAPVWRKGEA
jgi:hypothetical protein